MSGSVLRHPSRSIGRARSVRSSVRCGRGALGRVKQLALTPAEAAGVSGCSDVRFGDV